MSQQDKSHSRKNILTGEWVLVSPHRTQRPWQGQTEEASSVDNTEFDAHCYLCAGNTRANGAVNPDYTGPFIFDNDFAALSADSPLETVNEGLYQNRSESGRCRVVCFSEKHNERLATMSVADIARALRAIFDDVSDLSASGSYDYVQAFENRGEMMGCSNMHPHAQIWATEHLPNEPAKELVQQKAYFEENASRLLLDYLAAESDNGSRLVASNARFTAMVPYWAIWPFEQLIMPNRALANPAELDADDIHALADILKKALTANDRLFETSAPYSMGFHAAPCDGDDHPEWQFHIHIYPPLLRSSTIKKHLVGFELLGMPQRDLTPEVAAERLRAALEQ